MSKNKAFIPPKDGFTLIEIMIVVVIVGILSAVALPRYISATRDSNQNACNANVINLNSQWELAYVTRGLATYPNLSEVSHEKNYFPDGPPVCPYKTPYEDGNADSRVDPHVH